MLGHADADPNPDAHSHAEPDSCFNADTYAYSDPFADAHPYSQSYSHSDEHADAYADTFGHAFADADSDADFDTAAGRHQSGLRRGGLRDGELLCLQE